MCVEKWDNVTYEEEMQERKTFRGWAYGQDGNFFAHSLIMYRTTTVFHGFRIIQLIVALQRIMDFDV